MSYETPHDEIKSVAKRVAALSVVTTIVYSSVAAWRMSVNDEYRDQLINAQNVTLSLEDNIFFNFYINSSNLFQYNYVIILLLSLLLPICGFFGANNRDRFLLQFFCCCNGVMTVVSFGMLMNFALIGNACTAAYSDTFGDCALLSSSFYGSVILYGILFLLYMFSTFYSNRLYNNPYLTTANRYNKNGGTSSGIDMTPVATYASRPQPAPQQTGAQEIHVHVHTGMDV